MEKINEITCKILNSAAGIILCAVSLAVFYLPYELRIIPEVLDIAVYVADICAVLLILAFFALYISRMRLFRDNFFLWAALAFIAVLLYSTELNMADDMQGALGFKGLAAVFIAMMAAVFFRVNPKKYILTAFFVLMIYVVMNAYTVFAYWGVGMWEEYGQYRNVFFSLVGNYNGGIEYVIPMILCGLAYAHLYGAWLQILNYPLMILNLIMAVKCDSLTQELAFILILAAMVLGDILRLSDKAAGVVRHIFSPVILIAADIIIFLIVVVKQITSWVSIFGIDPDFHKRSHIWSMSLKLFESHPLWGNGQESVVMEASKITGYAHSHCTYLEIMYKTGTVGTVIMLIMTGLMIFSILKLSKHRTAYIISAVTGIFALAGIVESYPLVCVIMCFGLAYYICRNADNAVIFENVIADDDVPSENVTAHDAAPSENVIAHDAAPSENEIADDAPADAACQCAENEQALDDDIRNGLARAVAEMCSRDPENDI